MVKRFRPTKGPASRADDRLSDLIYEGGRHQSYEDDPEEDGGFRATWLGRILTLIWKRDQPRTETPRPE